MDHATSQMLTLLVPVLILAMVLRRNLRTRSLRMERLWIYPAILIALTGVPMGAEPFPSLISLVGYVGAIILGGVAGWYRGRLTTITINPKTHEFASRASIAGTFLIGVVFAARYGIRMAMANGGPAFPGELHLNVTAITQGMMMFLVGMVSVQRLEMFLRCRRMLATARSNGA